MSCLLAHLLDRAHEMADAPVVEGDAVEHSRRCCGPQPLEPLREIALVLAAQRVEAERARDRLGVAAAGLARAVEHAARSR